MDASLDESVSAWNHCRKTEDFDLYDWKQEVQKLFNNQQMALFDGPLGVEAEKMRKILSLRKYTTLKLRHLDS